jgi:hypothetical protein
VFLAANYYLGSPQAVMRFEANLTEPPSHCSQSAPIKATRGGSRDRQLINRPSSLRNANVHLTANITYVQYTERDLVDADKTQVSRTVSFCYVETLLPIPFPIPPFRPSDQKCRNTKPCLAGNVALLPSQVTGSSGRALVTLQGGESFVGPLKSARSRL